MLYQFSNIKKLFLLGIAVASTKVVLLLFAYFFNAENYNLFNQIYYTASMVILFGSLGFNIAVTRVGLNLKLVAVAVLVNVFIAYVFLQVTDGFAFSMGETTEQIVRVGVLDHRRARSRPA